MLRTAMAALASVPQFSSVSVHAPPSAFIILSARQARVSAPCLRQLSSALLPLTQPADRSGPSGLQSSVSAQLPTQRDWFSRRLPPRPSAASPPLAISVSQGASFTTIRAPSGQPGRLQAATPCSSSHSRIGLVPCSRLVERQQRRPTIGVSRDIQSSLTARAMAPGVEEHSGTGDSEQQQQAGTRPTVGFLGLGIMGVAMARNLVKAGYSVTAWNRNPDKCLPLVAEGARSAATAEEVTRSCDITFAMLADPVAARQVALGEGGAVAGLSSGKGYIDASTVDADTVKAVAAAVRAAGGQYLEAPVSGSKKPAEDGTLIFLAAGDKELFDKASDMLDVLGKYKVFLGAEGNGAAMKLVVNMVMGSMMTAFSEGLALGEKAGLDPKQILDVIAQGAISSPMFTLKGPGMVGGGKYPPAFPLKHQQKDLRLALSLGDELEQPLPVAAAANEVFKKARSQGYGDNDFSAVVEAVRDPKAS